MSRKHGVGHHSDVSDTLAAIATASGGGSAGLIATVQNFVAGPVGPLSNSAFTEIVAAPAVTVAAGQKVIVHTSVEYDATLGNGTAQNVEQQIQDQTTHVYDDVTQSCFGSAATGTAKGAWVVDRTREFVGLSAGSYIFSVWSEKSGAGNPAVSATNASIVVELVAV